MNEEIPSANPPLTAEEQAAVDNLSDPDAQAIDAAILGNASVRWRKVALVVGLTEDVLKSRYPHLSYVFYAQRLCRLVKKGQLDSQGNVLHMRFGEVRLPPP